jgi:hypothetical protein
VLLGCALKRADTIGALISTSADAGVTPIAMRVT